jgi:hypothetical protein
MQRLSLSRFLKAPMSVVPSAWLKKVRGKKSRWNRVCPDLNPDLLPYFATAPGASGLKIST